MVGTKNDDSRNNALSHGLYARDILLPCESEHEFRDLHTGLVGEFEPDGLAEKEQVLVIAVLYWKRRRVMIGSSLAYRRHPDAAAFSKAGESGWAGVAEHIEATSRKMDGVGGALREVVKSHAAILQRAFFTVNEQLQKLELMSTTQGVENLEGGQFRSESQARRLDRQVDVLTELTEALNGIGSSIITPVLKIMENQGIEQNLAERAFHPDIIERELKVLALVDKQIEKALAHLIHLKEYKRLYRKKQITVSDAG